MESIREIANKINEMSSDYIIGNLQEIRKKIKNFDRRPGSKIFTAETIKNDDGYAYHFGGRKELQFNIGKEKEGLRYGIAFSLEPSQTLPDISLLFPNILKFNQFIKENPLFFKDYSMWYWQKGRSEITPVNEIPKELLISKTFIFIGKINESENVEYENILETFDELLIPYVYVEDNLRDEPRKLNDIVDIIYIPGVNTMKNNNEDTVQEDIEYEIPLSKRKIVNQSSEPTIISLCDRIDKGKVEVRAEFQRQYVWEKKPAIKSRLIESVILNVPIPAIYTAEDEYTGKEIVIDGQQRILTFHGFIKNKFKLKGLSVLSELNGYYYKDLSNLKDETIKHFTDELGDLQESICDRPIRVIKILKESHPDIKFEIFERLNSGSVKLNDQELRNCIYRGDLNDLLKILVKNKDFQRLQGLNEEHLRMLDAERVLRFFAFCDKSERNYKSPLKKFLNDYMKSKQKIAQNEIEEKEQLFKKCVELCQTVFGNTAFRRIFPGDEDNFNGYVDDSLNQGIFDVQMYGFMEYQKRDIVPKSQVIMEAFADLATSNKKFVETIEIGTYGTMQVKRRTEMWINRLREIANYPSDDKRLFTYEDKKRLFESNNVCTICKNKISFIEDAHVDHIERFSEGGKTEIKNGRLTHRYCNLQRG